MSYSKMPPASSPKVGTFGRSSFKPFLRTCTTFLNRKYKPADVSPPAKKCAAMLNSTSNDQFNLAYTIDSFTYFVSIYNHMLAALSVAIKHLLLVRTGEV